jgi:hypothetical protein
VAMKPILYNETVPLFREYKFLYPLNKGVMNVTLSRWVKIKMFIHSSLSIIKREFIFWMKMIGFLDLK